MTPSQDWQEKAACSGMSSYIFFPSSADHSENKRLTAIAQSVCASCPVSAECGAYARHSNEGRRERHGIWNGVDHERSRSRLVWDLTCRQCLQDFETPVMPGMSPWYCSELCKTAARRVARNERNRRYRGDPRMQSVGL